MILQIFNKNGLKTTFTVRTVLQDTHKGMDVLYYEVPADEEGKGSFIPLAHIAAWRVNGFLTGKECMENGMCKD